MSCTVVTLLTPTFRLPFWTLTQLHPNEFECWLQILNVCCNPYLIVWYRSISQQIYEALPKIFNKECSIDSECSHQFTNPFKIWCYNKTYNHITITRCAHSNKQTNRNLNPNSNPKKTSSTFAIHKNKQSTKILHTEREFGNRGLK